MLLDDRGLHHSRLRDDAAPLLLLAWLTVGLSESSLLVLHSAHLPGSVGWPTRAPRLPAAAVLAGTAVDSGEPGHGLHAGMAVPQPPATHGPTTSLGLTSSGLAACCDLGEEGSRTSASALRWCPAAVGAALAQAIAVAAWLDPTAMSCHGV